jgi:hypothetical protein
MLLPKYLAMMMVNINRIPLEIMLNKTESAMPLVYDSAFINLKKFISREFITKVFTISLFYSLREFLICCRGTETQNLSCNFRASVATQFCLWQNLFLKNNGSKLKSITRQSIYSFTFAAYALCFN